MKGLVISLAAVAFSVIPTSLLAFGNGNFPVESGVTLYTGKPLLPKGYGVTDGIWHDDQRKSIGEPKVNFAGKYWVGLHSCGAECRYYSMLDLSTGAELRALDMFSTTEPPSKTQDGAFYTTDILTTAHSKILVAQYHVIVNKSGKEECRERTFVLKKTILVPITKTKPGCDFIRK